MKHKRTSLFLSILFLVLGFRSIDLSAYEKSDFKIAVFKEEGFPYVGMPEGFSVEWLGNELEKKYKVTYMTAGQLQEKGLLNADNIDLLILPYGEAIAGKTLPYIVDFVKKGGGLFTTAGRPFGSVFEKEGKYWNKKDEAFVQEYLSSLGLGYYAIYGKDIYALSNEQGIYDIGFRLTPPLDYQYGLCVKTSERLYDRPPTKGNVFPYRLPARCAMTPVILTDKDGNHIGSPAVFVKSWGNPYMAGEKIPDKWCLMGFRGENHPLNPNNEGSAERLRDILGFLSTRIIITGLQTDYACYRDGEAVRIVCDVLNYGRKSRNAEITFYVSEGNNVLFEKKEGFLIDAQEKKTITIAWDPGQLKGDFYNTEAALSLDGEIVDEEKNGFAVWHRPRLEDFKGLGVNGRYFSIDGKPFYLYGINYYESTLGELMWVRPNIFNIEKDLKNMSDFGINFLRIHYHPPKWFRDYFKVMDMPLPPYFNGIADSILPDERSLRVLDAFIVLCRRYGIYFQPDIFTLVPEEMGDPAGWIGDVGRCKDNEKIKLQRGFVKLLAERYRGIPNITWDLWNEPFLGGENQVYLKGWAGKIAGYFREAGDTHLVTLGSDESIELIGELDFLCGHGYEIKVPSAAKPFIMQEVWNESDLNPEKEELQAKELQKDFNDCIKQGAAGFAPWQWTRQSRLWDDASGPEKWDDELGLCVREDGSLKPAGRAYKELIKDGQ